MSACTRSPHAARSRPTFRRSSSCKRPAAGKARTSPAQLALDFGAVPTAASAVVDECAFCQEHLGKPCRACERLARRIHALVFHESDVPLVACRLGLTTEFCAELLAEEEDRLALADTRVEPVANAGLRQLCTALAEDDSRIYARIAERGGWASPSDVRRLLGLQRTSRKTVRGRVYPGRFLVEISPHAAGRIARALGLLPLDVDWPEASSHAAIRPLTAPR